MTNAPSTDTSDPSLTRDMLYAARYYLGGHRALFFLAAVLIVGGIALNWGWLVAVGLAPILLALLPCAAMCALGLCLHKTAGSAHGSSQSGTAGSARVQATDTDNSHGRVADTSDLFDPVSGRTLPAATAIASVHHGRIYYFEDRANRDAFETEPEKYLTGSQLISQEASSTGEPGKQSHEGHGCCC
jgi:YHS domain-containing protein